MPNANPICPKCTIEYAIGSTQCANCAALLLTSATQYGGRNRGLRAAARQSIIIITLFVAFLVAFSGIVGAVTARSSCQTGDNFCLPESPSHRAALAKLNAEPSPTLTPYPNHIDEPTLVVKFFLDSYAGSDAELSQVASLFTRAYDKAKPSALVCALAHARAIYGKPIIAPDIAMAVFSEDSALVSATITTPSGRSVATFFLKHGDNGWKIERIAGWLGGDIAADDPANEATPCLNSPP